MVLSTEEEEQLPHPLQVASRRKTLTQLSFPLSVSEKQHHCHQSRKCRDITVWESWWPGLGLREAMGAGRGDGG